MAARGEQRPRRHERKERPAPPPSASSSSSSGLQVKGRFANDLPLPPVPKLLRALPGCRRFSALSMADLDAFERPVVLGRDPENLLDLVDHHALGQLPKVGDMAPPLRPEEQKLVSDYDLSHKQVDAEKKRKRLTEETEAFHREAFGLQLPQLLSNDIFVERQVYTTGTESAEKKLSRNPPERLSNEEMTAEVEKTFTAASKPPVHPANPALKARRIMPVVPDAMVWANKYRQVVFDQLPESPKRQDLLFMTVPSPRITCFGYFSSPSEDGHEGNTYRLAQNYMWENRGGYSREVRIDEGETLLLSYPNDGEEGEARFVMVPPWMRLKKLKAHTLEVAGDTQILRVSHREPSVSEAAEEHARMGVVMRDEGQETDTSDVAWVDGQWVVKSLRGDSSKDASSLDGGKTPRDGGRTPRDGGITPLHGGVTPPRTPRSPAAGASTPQSPGAPLVPLQL